MLQNIFAEGLLGSLKLKYIHTSIWRPGLTLFLAFNPTPLLHFLLLHSWPQANCCRPVSFLSNFMLLEEKLEFTFFLFLNLGKNALSTFMANSSFILLHSFHISQSSPFYTFTQIQLSGVEFHRNLNFTHFTHTHQSVAVAGRESKFG